LHLLNFFLPFFLFIKLLLKIIFINPDLPLKKITAIGAGMRQKFAGPVFFLKKFLYPAMKVHEPSR